MQRFEPRHRPFSRRLVVATTTARTRAVRYGLELSSLRVGPAQRFSVFGGAAAKVGGDVAEHVAADLRHRRRPSLAEDVWMFTFDPIDTPLPIHRWIRPFVRRVFVRRAQFVGRVSVSRWPEKMVAVVVGDVRFMRPTAFGQRSISAAIPSRATWLSWSRCRPATAVRGRAARCR